MPFPTTPILDTFNRADENPLSDGGKWGGIVKSGQSPMKLVSNQAVASVGGNNNSAYWSANQFQDCEIYIDVPSLPTSSHEIVVYGRITGPGGANPPRYAVELFPSNGDWFITYEGNQISSDVFVGFSAGDSIGMSIVGNVITAWHKTGGVWSPIMSITDSSNPSPGYLGIWAADVATAYANFGGGTYNPAGLPMAGGQIEGGWMETRPRSEFIG